MKEQEELNAEDHQIEKDLLLLLVQSHHQEEYNKIYILGFY
jgi:hypothetical protein